MVCKALLVALIALSGYHFVWCQNNGPMPQLVGRWVEDESKRTGLNDFLWARGSMTSFMNESDPI